MDKPIKLTIGRNFQARRHRQRRRPDVFSTSRNCGPSELHVRMDWRDSKLGGTGPAYS